MDHLTVVARSENMSKIKSKNTGPELKARKVLTKLGLKYRLHSAKLPGKPDIVIPSRKTAVFINGCFWHQHKGCKKCTIPSSNSAFWKEKLSYNVERQKKQIREIEAIGMRTIVVWECEVNNADKLSEKFKGAFI
ncbi:DNA mismatch endonuclease Vsr [Candidatus Microgenomates bacterium]|nr:DNA mismatch endonuclease Vsr [Candidatus Microgenomates bacterium]